MGGGHDRDRGLVIVVAVLLALGAAHGLLNGGWIQAVVNGAGVLAGGSFVHLLLRAWRGGRHAPEK